MAEKKLKKTPTNLSWRRSIDISEGLMYGLLPDDSKVPVQVLDTTVRGAMAAYTAGYDAKGEPLTFEALQKAQKPETPNIQRIHVARLPAETDVLVVEFAMGVHGANTRPDACSERAFVSMLADFTQAAIDAGLYEEIAERYIWALVNGSILWRNGVGIEKRVTLKTRDGLVCDFDTEALSTRNRRKNFPGFAAVAAADSEGNADKLKARVASALAGDGYLAIDARAKVRLFNGAEVWPSQEFVQNAKEKGDGDLGKILSYRRVQYEGMNIMHATMHPQKLGNAVRTIDEWHGNAEYGAIPVEAFGWVQNDLTAIRSGGKDMYGTLKALPVLIEGLKEGDNAQRADALYFLGMLIRGGVYGMGNKRENEE